MIFRNLAKEKLRAGEPVVGFNVFECLLPSVARIVAQTGYDFVLVETEHIRPDPEHRVRCAALRRGGPHRPLPLACPGVRPDRRKFRSRR